MTYVPSSLDCTTGVEDPDTCLITAATITASWVDFPDNGSTSIIKFQVTLNASVTSGQVITNRANILWTSLPNPAGNTALSAYNALSVERTGDTECNAANDYKDSDTAQVTIVTGVADQIDRRDLR